MSDKAYRAFDLLQGQCSYDGQRTLEFSAAHLERLHVCGRRTLNRLLCEMYICGFIDAPDARANRYRLTQETIGSLNGMGLRRHVEGQACELNKQSFGKMTETTPGGKTLIRFSDYWKTLGFFPQGLAPKELNEWLAEADNERRKHFADAQEKGAAEEKPLLHSDCANGERLTLEQEQVAALCAAGYMPEAARQFIEQNGPLSQPKLDALLRKAKRAPAEDEL
jgi:hypothetical protein